MKVKNIQNKIFNDSKGNIVLWQSPNIPLWVWILTTLLGKIFTTGTFSDLLKIVAFGAIFTWAYLEITDGVNYFRRGLGVLVLILTVLGQIR